MSRSTFVKSTLILSIATLLSKILGSIFRIPLQNIAGDEVLGIFSLVYPVYMVALYLSVAGIPVAISKLIAEARAKDDHHSIKEIYRTASILALIFGVLSFTLIYSFSHPIAASLGGPETRLALIVVAATLLVAPYMAVYRGYFQGFEDMKPTAFSQVLEQFIRVGIILAAAYYLVAKGYENDLVAAGVMSGSIVGAFISLIYLRAKFQRSNVKPTSKTSYSFHSFTKWSKKILTVSIPIAIGAITMALINFIDSFTIPFALKSAGSEASNINFLYGIYGRGLALVQIATVFATSLVLPLIPHITKKLAEKDFTGTRGIIERTHSMTHMISWPAAMGLLALTLPMNLALFTDLKGSLLLAIIGFSSVFTSLTVLGTGILQGINVAKLAASIIFIGVALKTILNIYFIHLFGLEGAALSTLLIYMILFVLNSIFIYKRMAYQMVNGKIVKIILSSIAMGAIIGLPTLFIDFASWTRLEAIGYVGVSIILGAGIYFLLLYVLKVIDSFRIKRLPIIGKIFNKTPIRNTEKNSTGKDERKLMKRVTLWALILLLLIVSIPGLANRWEKEAENNKYELILPYQEIFELTKDGSVTLDQALTALKDAGLTSVSFLPFSLSSWEEQGIITVYSEEELKDALRFSDMDYDFDEKEGFYITIPDNPSYHKKIVENFDQVKLTVGNESLYFIPNGDGIGLDSVIGYDEEAIKKVKNYGLNYVLRMENSDFTSNIKMISEAIRIKNGNSPNILFSGLEVVGYPNIEHIKSWAKELVNAGYNFHSIEFTYQKGLQTIARETDYKIVRLHSIRLGEKTLEENVDRIIRAIKERKMRSIFLHVDTENTPPMENLEIATSTIEAVHAQMPDQFEPGIPTPLKQIEIPTWVLTAVLLAGILFTLLVSEIVESKLLRLAATGFMGLVAIAYLVTERLILLQGFALIIAIITSIYAVLAAREGSTKLSVIALQFAKAIGISLVGITIVIGLLNGNAFITGFELFRGVKLVYLVPIVFIAIYLFWRQGFKFLNANVKYWHVIVITFLGAGMMYYIMRTGNAGTVSEIELMIRYKLEELLYVRPRTKEFLIGFPLFVLALYVMGINKTWGKVLLIPGAIGFVSIMNTFTHLHIPLSISLLRTVYGVVFGFIIGLVLIALFKIGYRYISKANAMR